MYVQTEPSLYAKKKGNQIIEKLNLNLIAHSIRHRTIYTWLIVCNTVPTRRVFVIC
jgi:hypothetical protein